MTMRIAPFVIAAAAVSASVFAAEHGTPAEAKALLKKAAAHYTQVGRKQALADFTGKKDTWVDRDLYVVCIDADHTVTANGAFPSYVGTSADGLRDADRNPLGKAFWNAVSNGAEGSVQYRWFNPVSGKIERKISFVRKLGDEVCAVGVYAEK